MMNLCGVLAAAVGNKVSNGTRLRSAGETQSACTLARPLYASCTQREQFETVFLIWPTRRL
jgi:hypothetical protein